MVTQDPGHLNVSLLSTAELKDTIGHFRPERVLIPGSISCSCVVRVQKTLQTTIPLSQQQQQNPLQTEKKFC